MTFLDFTTNDVPLPPQGIAESRGSDPVPAATPFRLESLSSQIAQRIASMPLTPDRDTPMELTLDPPELGTIRVSISRGAEGMMLHLLADNPDTLDLLRRHGGALMQELQRQGLEHSGYSFSGRNEGGHQPEHASGNDPGPSESSPATPDRSPPERHPATMPSGLDIRL